MKPHFLQSDVRSAARRRRWINSIAGGMGGPGVTHNARNVAASLENLTVTRQPPESTTFDVTDWTQLHLIGSSVPKVENVQFVARLSTVLAKASGISQ
jgi:hypothetical protein